MVYICEGKGPFPFYLHELLGGRGPPNNDDALGPHFYKSVPAPIILSGVLDYTLHCAISKIFDQNENF